MSEPIPCNVGLSAYGFDITTLLDTLEEAVCSSIVPWSREEINAYNQGWLDDEEHTRRLEELYWQLCLSWDEAQRRPV